MQLTWQPPQNYRSRPVVVLGAGVLGRRIGMQLNQNASTSKH